MPYDLTERQVEHLSARVRALSETMEPMPTPIQSRQADLSGVKAVLFDVYGTLFMSGSGDIGVAAAVARGDALEAALRAIGIEPGGAVAQRGVELLHACISETHTRIKESGTAYPEVEIREIWSDSLLGLKGEGLLDDIPEPEKLAELAVEYECRVNPVWPMPDVAGTIRGLRDAGHRLGIVSNAQFYTPLLFKAFIEHLPWQMGFDDRLCTWSYELRESKPSERLFTQSLAELQSEGISPQETLYVGNDMLNDIWPASTLGMKTALFAGDARSLRLREDDPNVAGVTPDTVITRLGQLAKCFSFRGWY